jgi:DNA-binding MarR family transcriptional regulator
MRKQKDRQGGEWEMSAKEMEALMLVALKPNEFSLRGLAAALDVPPGAMTTRLFDRLGRGSIRTRGLELIDGVDVPENRRIKLLFLTNKGEQALSRMLDTSF